MSRRNRVRVAAATAQIILDETASTLCPNAEPSLRL
jgi:hypothetical protein